MDRAERTARQSREAQRREAERISKIKEAEAANERVLAEKAEEARIKEKKDVESLNKFLDELPEKKREMVLSKLGKKCKSYINSQTKGGKKKMITRRKHKSRDHKRTSKRNNHRTRSHKK